MEMLQGSVSDIVLVLMPFLCRSLPLDLRLVSWGMSNPQSMIAKGLTTDCQTVHRRFFWLPVVSACEMEASLVSSGPWSRSLSGNFS